MESIFYLLLTWVMSWKRQRTTSIAARYFLPPIRLLWRRSDVSARKESLVAMIFSVLFPRQLLFLLYFIVCFQPLGYSTLEYTTWVSNPYSALVSSVSHHIFCRDPPLSSPFFVHCQLAHSDSHSGLQLIWKKKKGKTRNKRNEKKRFPTKWKIN